MAVSSRIFPGFGCEQLPVDPRLPVGREHPRDFVEREACGTADRDQRETFDHTGVEKPAQPAPPRRGDQSQFLVIAQRRGGYADSL
jgi:hypothetical protein